MITRDRAERFAREWVEAWNAHDLDAILSHYHDDFEMASPRIATVVGEPSGRTGWILARTSTIEPEIYDKGISVLRAMGYDTSQMQRVAQ